MAYHGLLRSLLLVLSIVEKVSQFSGVLPAWHTVGMLGFSGSDPSEIAWLMLGHLPILCLVCCQNWVLDQDATTAFKREARW